MANRLASLIFACAPSLIFCLDNGLGLTPPMGFMTWERYRCTTDCTEYPKECISEALIKRTAEIMVSQNYRDLGYNYIIIDCCWDLPTRDVTGRLQPNPERFPSGIKALADYLHSRGMKLGIHLIMAKFTSRGSPGSLENIELDANTMAEWGIDYVKLISNSKQDPRFLDEKYEQMGTCLNRTGRSMFYSCTYPDLQMQGSVQVDWAKVARICNSWRIADDVEDSWDVVQEIMDSVASKQKVIARYTGRGHWNDPDQLIIGDFGLSLDQSQAQMAVWAVIAAPLIMSVELADIRPEFKAVLQNKLAIRVNQDPLGNPGRRICTARQIDLWTRPIVPMVNGQYSWGVAFVSRRSDGVPYAYKTTLDRMGLHNPNGYAVQDVYNNTDYSDGEILKPCSEIEVHVNPSGCVFQIYTAL